MRKEVIFMPGRFDNSGTFGGGRRRRNRLRGMCTGRTGKAIGFTSIAAPLIGYVVNDLKKPDSIIRGLIGRTADKLLALKSKKVEAIDISDKVEVIEDNSTKKD
jgi:hypothetical protein